MKKTKTCPICNSEFEIPKYYDKTFCSHDCYLKNKSNNKKDPIIEHNKRIEKQHSKIYFELPTCKICGLKSMSLHSHIAQKHKIKVKTYLEQFNCNKNDIYHSTILHALSERMKGNNNIAFQHGGKYSPFSKKFIHYNEIKQDELFKKHSEFMKNNKDKNCTTIEYYLSKGMTRDEAKIALYERQAVGRKEKFIERYGNDAGLKRWKERQEKWLRSYPKNAFSKISQKLFWELYNKIKNDFKEIYFANNYCGELNEYVNKEYIVKTDKTFRRLDFYIKDINSCIEFDGDYWHGEKRGNQQRDDDREKEIQESNKGIKILHIKERDYIENSEKILNECLGFIYENN